MIHSDLEKVAIVLVNKYKDLVDIFKNGKFKSLFGHLQAVEVGLYTLTSDRPTAKKFFEKILEYRRKGEGSIEKFEIPVIEDDLPIKKEAVPVNVNIKPEYRQPEPVVETVVKKTEAKSEECPFEF